MRRCARREPLSLETSDIVLRAFGLRGHKGALVGDVNIPKMCVSSSDSK